MNHWVLNTDEAEAEGRGADRKMFRHSVAAAWGETFGALGKLSKPEAGDAVFFYKKGVGIIGMATFDHSAPFPSNEIFGMQQKGEFSRRVVELKTTPARVLSVGWIKEATGMDFRPLQTLFRIKNPVVASYLAESFDA